MSWRAISQSIMGTARRVMGEPVTVIRSGVSLALDPLTLTAIYEEATNWDETGAYGLADLENAKAMADFLATDLTMAPKRGDTLTVLATGEIYNIFNVTYDGWARYRCLLEEPIE